MKPSLTKIRSLDLANAPQEGRPCHISAASGLVADQNNFYVIGDDELCLATFSRDGSPGTLTKLFPGSLPLMQRERKKQKPDLESLIQFGDGLLAVPSGSTKHRMNGVFLKDGQPLIVDFFEIYEHLQKSLPELNIEGSVIRGDEFILLQRGNGPTHQNALVILDLEIVRNSVCSERPIPKTSVRKINQLDLGILNHVPLSFTDAALANNSEIWFLAAAEASDSTYLDGQYAGAILGKIDRNNNIISITELDCPQKPEGLAISSDGLNVWIVTDADDSEQASVLYELKIGTKIWPNITHGY